MNIHKASKFSLILKRWLIHIDTAFLLTSWGCDSAFPNHSHLFLCLTPVTFSSSWTWDYIYLRISLFWMCLQSYCLSELTGAYRKEPPYPLPSSSSSQVEAWIYPLLGYGLTLNHCTSESKVSLLDKECWHQLSHSILLFIDYTWPMVQSKGMLYFVFEYSVLDHTFCKEMFFTFPAKISDNQ